MSLVNMVDVKNSENRAKTFQTVVNPSELLPVLEKRLPEACFIYNQLKSYDKFTDDLEIYSIGTRSDADTWILTKFHREDYSLMISISAPNVVTAEQLEDMKETLLQSEVINWDGQFIFNALQGHIWQMILSINVDVFGNIVTLYPCILFYMKPENALKLEISAPDDSITVKPLQPHGGTEFITENWKYSNKDTHIFVRKSIERLPSGGVFVNDPAANGEELACGAITPGIGLISMLHTDPGHRRKGYASICMKYIFQQLALQGLQPCLISEICNTTAVNFHTAMGLESVARVQFISHKISFN